MGTIRRDCVALALLLLAACGSANDAAKRAEPPPVEETAFRDMAGAMDKARAVEDTARQHKEELDRTLQQAEGAADQ